MRITVKSLLDFYFHYSYSCSNPIYGITKNPHNPTRTSGGSSGGEGALVGAKGSIIGLGGDVGGSVRIPANFCGVCALKPTMGRFRFATFLSFFFFLQAFSLVLVLFLYYFGRVS